MPHQEYMLVTMTLGPSVSLMSSMKEERMTIHRVYRVGQLDVNYSVKRGMLKEVY